MNDWEDIVGSLSSEEDIRKEAEQKAAEERKLKEAAKKAALARIEEARSTIRELYAEIERLSDEHHLEVTVYGPDGSSHYYKADTIIDEDGGEWESSNAGCSSSSDYC